MAISKLEEKLQNKLESRKVVGRVSDVVHQTPPLHISARRVTFPWQRGFKIGEGRFGKVYTAVNNLTGELIAMKEIRLQPNDHRAIKEAMDEIRTFEGIKHPNIVRYYGVEIHREEMLIFMEYCNEGSLESASQLHLPETLVRKYTRKLLEAVNVLHEHGIVHRDIKSANVFLTSDGNLKLGDFGCCIKLKNHTTMPGELCSFVGTPAYMAPEIFTKSITEGHGRAADIWSVGCVVLEMASGRRPWHDLENSYQIMFRVGMGEIPNIPESLSDEGRDFLNHCLQHDPHQRWTASMLLDHPFTKVIEDDDII
ncbi:mitogen-activated protein kinase kinase kinase 4-like [Centruroides sculpturatus]|nr:mitogen-activated protein kinase kinase kinase 4-like [Centruroides sculpturatus]